MVFEKFDYIISNMPFHILPSIMIIKNDRFLLQENISIEFGWLCFHCRWRWLKEQK